jgi:hypothetical protein
MTYIYNPQELKASENTFVTALAFSTATGVLTATRNDGVQLTTDLDNRYVTENTHTTSATFNSSDGVLTLNQTDPVGTVTVDLDGRFPTENTHLDSASLGVDNVLSLGMVNPSSTITVDLSELDLNTHLDSAAFNSTTKILTLNLVNPTSQITVDLSGIQGDDTYVTSANFVDGTLNLNRNDGATVSVSLDNRYSQINTHLNAASFDSVSRNLTLTTTDPAADYIVNIPTGPDEDTYLSSLAFNSNSGALNATLNTGTVISAELDGRYNLISNNTHLNSASFNSATGQITLNMINPVSQIVVDISDTAGENTHLDSASFNVGTKILSLNLVNPASTITVDLDGIEGQNTYITSASFNTANGLLRLIQTNPVGSISVNLDGRYSTQNTYLDEVSFNNETRELSLEMVNPSTNFTVTIPGGPDENTYLSSLAFNTNSGALNATLNTGSVISTDLDGRYNLIGDNTHLNTGTFNTSTGILSLNMVNPVSQINIPIETSESLNTHLDSASLTSNDVLNLNMVNPSSTISVDLKPVLQGEYLPIDFTDEKSDLNTLLEPGVYSLSTTAVPRPLGIVGSKNYLTVYSIKDGAGVVESAVQIWSTGTNSNSPPNSDPPRRWMRTYENDGEYPTVSHWRELTTDGLNGYLRQDFGSDLRDFNNKRFRESGLYYIGQVNGLGDHKWENGPTTYPTDSDFAVLETVLLPNSMLDGSYGNGYQELSCSDYDTTDKEVRKYRRVFEASSTVENYTDWVEFMFDGVPIKRAIYSIYDHNYTGTTSINVTNQSVINLTTQISQTYHVARFFGGVKGQRIDLIKTTNTGMVVITHQNNDGFGNIVTPNGPNTVVTLRYNRGASFVFDGQYWYPTFSNTAS